jgi:hypothetical protein
MGRSEQQFENYLREFEPRRPGALPLQGDLRSWRRLAAAAGVTIALGASLWLALRSPSRQQLQIATNAAPGQNEEAVRVRRLSALQLTKLAVTDPARLDAELSAASRRVLPDFRTDNSALRLLAKE